MADEFDALMREADAAIFEVMGQDATYTPLGGSPLSWRAEIRQDQALLDGDGLVTGRATTVSGPVIAGQHYGSGDQITLGGQSYSVHAPLENDGFVVTLVVTPT
tara:strand:- start:16322 stop:16633 length:312 start_codon:yes stop_codon:yes gene_type:complete